jgi:SAM-dependent methyltransferase
VSGDSVAFDRAAEYYDETRRVPERHLLDTVEMIADEVGERGRVLEVGVGTGLLALPLHERGAPVVGLDLSEPMLRQLVKKAGRRAPFPIVRGDATRMPFADGAFGAAYLRWVLHLIPAWAEALRQVARAVHPGGRILVTLGSYGGPRDLILERFEAITGVPTRPAGIGFGADDELDDEASRLGLVVRRPRVLHEQVEETLQSFLDGIRANSYSWTWPVRADVLVDAAARLGPWMVERFGPLDRPIRYTSDVPWHVFEVSGQAG